MRKLKRPKVIKSWLEDQIAKNQERIQKLSEQNFRFRKELEAWNKLQPQKPLTKADLEARDKAAEEAEKAASEPVLDNADQEIGVTPTEA